MKFLFFTISVYIITLNNSASQIFEPSANSAGMHQMTSNNGISVADYDGDGDIDLFIVARINPNTNDGAVKCKLYKNNNSGSFSDVTEESGIATQYDISQLGTNTNNGYNMGASWGDYNRDGYPDLFISSMFRDILYKNNGNGTFTDATTDSGLHAIHDCENVNALWWDYNLDGFLDLFIIKYNFCGYNRLFKNNGDETFTDVTTQLEVEGKYKHSWAALSLDVNQDHFPDLYVANDFGEPNELFINHKGLYFTEESAQYGLEDLGRESMGIDVGDINGDGLFDIYVTSIESNSLYLSKPDRSYHNAAEDLKLAKSGWAWAAKFSDLDLDGDEDILAVNGYLTEQEENVLFRNPGWPLAFEKVSDQSGLGGKSVSLGLAVFDYDNDGDHDIVFGNTSGAPFFYENKSINANSAASNWSKISLKGTTSNIDAIGSVVRLVANGKSRARLHHGAVFPGQNIQPVHFGLGQSKNISSINITWPGGQTETFENLPINKVIEISENQGYKILDIKPAQKKVGCTNPTACNYDPLATSEDGSCQFLEQQSITGASMSELLKVEEYSYAITPGSHASWSIENGTIISGQGTDKVTVKWGIAKHGKINVVELGDCLSQPVFMEVALTAPKNEYNQSIARIWNELLLEIIRDEHKPTVNSRNMFHAHIAMYDTWAIHQQTGETYLIGKQLYSYKNKFDGFTPPMSNKHKFIAETLSYALYRLFTFRYRKSQNTSKVQDRLNDLMEILGYDIGFTSSDYSAGNSAALGNFIGKSIITYGLLDNSNEAFDYQTEDYVPQNNPLDPKKRGNPELTDPNRWQPVFFKKIQRPGHPTLLNYTQSFLTPHWGELNPFSSSQEFIDQKLTPIMEAPPKLGNGSPHESSWFYIWNFSSVPLFATLCRNGGPEIDISPKNFGNVIEFPVEPQQYQDFFNPKEFNFLGRGHPINQHTNKSYTENIVSQMDFINALSTYWHTESSGMNMIYYWFQVLNKINDHPAQTKKFRGQGTELDNLEWDIKSYFILAGSIYDATIFAWKTKKKYDFIRPISAVRHLAANGQSTESTLPGFSTSGIGLLEGFIEIVKSSDSLAIADQNNVGKVKILAPERKHDSNNTTKQLDWYLGENWTPNNTDQFLSPPSPGFISNISAVSYSAAEALAQFTGTSFFPGGIYSSEQFPSYSKKVSLQSATYQDLASQAGFMSLVRGICSPVDDINGRRAGSEIGKKAFEFASKYFEPRILSIENKSIGIKIYPNPVLDGPISIHGPSLSEKPAIINIFGQRIEATFTKNSSNILLVELPNIPSGIYFFLSGDHAYKFLKK